MEEEKLKEDLEKAEKMMSYFSKHQKENYRIIKQSYLTPQFLSIVMPMNHLSGLFMYYRNISDALQSALSTGRVPRQIMPKNPPKYLEELAA